MKAAIAALFGGIMLVLTLAGSSPLLLLLALVVGWFGPDVWLAREGRLRQERIERDLPDFLDILAVTVRAGLGYRAALGRVAEELGGPISEEMLTALRQMELGASRRQAFLALRERSTSESLASFVAAQLQAEELRDATEARHVQAIWLLAQGRAVLDVAEVLAFAPRWVEELAARYNAHGPAALGDQRRRNGRAASVLTPALLAALAERLRAPPEDGGRWTGPKVALWMARYLGVERVHPQRGWEALKRVRGSIQAPRPRRSRVPRPRTPASRSRSAKSRATCAEPRTSTASA